MRTQIGDEPEKLTITIDEDQATVLLERALLAIQELLPEALGDGEDKVGATLEIVKWAQLIDGLL